MNTRLIAKQLATPPRNNLPIYEATEAPRAQCAWQHARTHVAIIHGPTHTYQAETMHLELRHASHKHPNTTKWSLHVGGIHHQLRQDLEAFHNESGNTIAVDMTFQLKIETSDTYTNITFPLRVPNKKVVTISDAKETLSATHRTGNVYTILRSLYQRGKTKSNVTHTHGYEPKYDGTPYDQGYVHHSEQALAAYLTTPTACEMLVNRLRTEMRGLDLAPLGERIKIYGTYLHIYSDKTPCGPCEFTLVGLQRSNEEASLFTQALEAALHNDQSVYRFYTPKNGLRCLVTYAAKDNDATHRRAYSKRPIAANANRAPTILQTREDVGSNHLAVAQYFEPAVAARLTTTTIHSRSIFASASEQNQQTAVRRRQYSHTADREVENLSEAMTQLFR